MEIPASATPLIRQYLEVKRDFPDAILFFRLGDFYEMFFEDAKTAAGVLGITLTSRDKRSENPVPLCGVPYHSADQYIAKLLDRGFKVAICEQMEDPQTAKGIVKREVVRVVTPALRTDQEGLKPTEQSVLVSIAQAGQKLALAWLDVSSLRFEVCQSDRATDVFSELCRLSPREVLLPDGFALEPFAADLALLAQRQGIRLERRPSAVYHRAEEKLAARFSLAGTAGLGLAAPELCAAAAWAALEYVEQTSRSPLPHLAPPKPYHWGEFLYMDAVTREHLELFPASRAGEDRSLFSVLNATRTSMGARLLREWMQFPLKDPAAIGARQDAIEELFRDAAARDRLREELRHAYDLERLIAKLLGPRANARDLAALRQTLACAVAVIDAAAGAKSSRLRALAGATDAHAALAEKLGRTIVDEPPASTQEGGMIRDGVHAELDGIRRVGQGGKEWLVALEARERARTGIATLKVGYNRVFGYFIEITKANLGKAPADYERRQTLAGAERFVTPELKEHESKILGAQERIQRMEAEIFAQLRREVVAAAPGIQALARALAEIDVYAALAHVAVRWDYVRPRVGAGFDLNLTQARHPVVERHLDAPFVSNSLELTRDRSMVVLTGPNMAGKSTIMRQMALVVHMAHMGAFVPAKEAQVGLVDRIFTRVGASDDLAGGRSTFMVEMNETANILRNATADSLVILDEIGRGTSTFDGLAIAWAVAEDLHDRVGCKTIFATHYHELTRLAATKPRIRNMNVAVREWNGEVVFVRALVDGAVNRSYGIEVARLAGVLPTVIARAREILPELEKSDPRPAPQQLSLDAPAAPVEQPLRSELLSVDLGHVTPLQALGLLNEWQSRYKS